MLRVRVFAKETFYKKEGFCAKGVFTDKTVVAKFMPMLVFVNFKVSS